MQQRRYTTQPHYGPVIPPYTELADGTPRESSSGLGTAAKVLLALALLGLAIATLVLVADDYSHGKSAAHRSAAEHAALSGDVAAVQGGIDDLADDHDALGDAIAGLGEDIGTGIDGLGEDHDAMSEALAGLADDHDAIQKQLDLIRAMLPEAVGGECPEQFRRPGFYASNGDGYSSEIAYDKINAALVRAQSLFFAFPIFLNSFLPHMETLDPFPRWWRADQSPTHAILDSLRGDLQALMDDDTVFDHEKVPIRSSLYNLDAVGAIIDTQCAINLAPRYPTLTFDWFFGQLGGYYWPSIPYMADETTTVTLINTYWREFIALVADAQADGGFGESVAAGCIASASRTSGLITYLRGLGNEDPDYCDNCFTGTCDTLALLGFAQASVDECYALAPAARQAHLDYANLIEAVPEFFGESDYLSPLPDQIRAPLLHGELIISQGEVAAGLTPQDIRHIGEGFRDSIVATMTSFGVSSGVFPAGTTFAQMAAAMSNVSNPDWYVSSPCLHSGTTCTRMAPDTRCTSQTYCPFDGRTSVFTQLDIMYATLYKLVGRAGTSRFSLVTRMNPLLATAAYSRPAYATRSGLWSSAGQFRLSTADLTRQNFTYQRFIMALALHEVTTGHEMQFDHILSSRLASLFVGVTEATREGWAFSAETLLDDLINVNTQPTQKMAQQQDRMRRALRLIAYAMLQDEGASIGDVIALYATYGVDAAAAIDDATRLIDEPSQIVSYALGGLYYEDTRAAAKAELQPLGLWSLPEWMDVYYQIGHSFDPVVHRILSESYVAWKKGEARCDTPYLRNLVNLCTQAEPYAFEWDASSCTQGSVLPAMSPEQKRALMPALHREMRADRARGVHPRNAAEARAGFAAAVERVLSPHDANNVGSFDDDRHQQSAAAAMDAYHEWVDSGAAAQVHADVEPARVQWDVVNALQ